MGFRNQILRSFFEHKPHHTGQLLGVVVLVLHVGIIAHLDVDVAVSLHGNLVPNIIAEGDHLRRTEVHDREGRTCKHEHKKPEPSLLVEEDDHLTIRLGLQRTAQSVEDMHGALRHHPQDKLPTP